MVYQFTARDRCPACLCPERNVLAEMPFNSNVLKPLLKRCYPAAPATLGGTYSVVICERCGTIYQAQVGDAAMLSELYESWVDTAPDPKWASEAEWLASNPKQSRDGHEIMTAAAMMGVQLSNLKTLDYGMGQGLWARVSLGLGCQSYGFDLSERCSRLGENHGVTVIDFENIAQGGFDFINTEQVMEHVTDVDQVMKQLVAGLRPSGLLKISVPAQNRVRTALSELMALRTPDAAELDPAFPLEHVNAFTVRGLEALGGRFGLRRVAPTRAQRFAYLRYPGSVSFGKPRNALKELVRPFTSYEGSTNLTMWFEGL